MEKQLEEIEVSIEEQNENPVAIQDTEKARLEKALSELDFNDRTSIIYFGSSAQEELDDISNRMIDGVKNKDTGAAGQVLNEMVAVIKGFDLEELDPNKKLPWYKNLFGGTKPSVKFMQGYEEVRDQTDEIATD